MLVGVDIDSKRLQLVLSHYDSSGRLAYIRKQLKEEDMFNWVVSDTPTDIVTWNKKHIRQSRTFHPSRFRMEELMSKYVVGDARQRLNEFNKPKVAILDIENYVNDNNDFTKPEEALFEINIISVLVEDTVYVMTILPELQSQDLQKMTNELNGYFKNNRKYKIEYMHFDTEKNLLLFFTLRMLPKLGFITGWNVVSYDWLYICNRCEKNGIQVTKGLVSDNMGQFKIPTHLAIIDYLDGITAFRRPKDIDNQKLDTVASKVLGVSKLENPYNTFKEFIKDTYLFTLYNIIDSCLIQNIDDKVKLLDSSFAIGKISELELSKIFSSVYMTEIFLCRQFMKKNIYLPHIQKRKINKKEKYAGAYVKEPIPCYYELVSCFDFNSMYPNIAIQYNISPETFLGFLHEGAMGDGILGVNRCITSKGTVFDTTEDSTTRILLTHYYDERKKIQKEMDDLKLELNDLEPFLKS